MSTKMEGLFMPEIDWRDPKFAPWNIANLDLNDTQRDALLISNEDTDFPNLTTEQQKEICLKIPCKVELFHSNVCKGVEKSWPKRMFKKDNFELLNPKEQRCIYRDMQRKAVLLYDTYVNEKRLADRRKRRTNRALAPFYELIYRKNLFMRIKALGEPEPGYDAVITETTILTDSEADVSQQTVINTGNTGTQKSSSHKEAIDLNDNDCSSDVMSENTDPPIANSERTPNWKSKSCYTITQNYSIQIIETMDENSNGIIASECNVSSPYDVESVVSSPQESVSRTPSQYSDGNAIPEVQSNDFVFATPSINHRNQLLNGNVDEESESEFDSLDFLSQGMTARTSTQRK